MPGEAKQSSETKYLSIGGGSLVEPSTEGAQGARLRKWETPDGKTGEKWELPYKNWTGLVQKIMFIETEYGEECKVVLDDATISVKTKSRYFADLGKKLCAADLSKPITFSPYDFETEVEGKGKKRLVGFTLTVDGVKLASPFYDPETKKTLGGFPVPAKKMDKDDWGIHFITVKKFLVEKLRGLTIPAANLNARALADKATEVFHDSGVDEEEVTIDDLPF